jgi:tRNA (guanine-N7-)-methyltransferase
VTDSSNSNKRPIRSYVIRSGRLTDSQRKAIDEHWQQYVLEYSGAVLDPSSVFERTSPLVVEIGFGMGDSLLQMAAENPTLNYIGIEVHKPGIGRVLHGIVDQGLSNLRIICHDAKEVMANSFAFGAIDKLQIFFPDPWPKKRHNKRRLVQNEFIQLAASRLRPCGEIHLATDVQAYAEHMLEVMEASTLSNAMGSQNYWPEPARPVTKFERRGQRLGHGVWDLLFATPG